MAFPPPIDDLGDVYLAIAPLARNFNRETRRLSMRGGGSEDEIQDLFRANQDEMLRIIEQRATVRFARAMRGPTGEGTPLLDTVSHAIFGSMNDAAGRHMDRAWLERRPPVPAVRDVIPTNRQGGGAVRRARRRRFVRQFSKR